MVIDDSDDEPLIPSAKLPKVKKVTKILSSDEGTFSLNEKRSF